MTIYEVIKRPIVTEKGVDKKDNERTLCFEVAPDANKTLVKARRGAAVQGESRPMSGRSNFDGKLRRRGQFSGYRSDWKKAYVRLKPGQKVPEYAEI